MKNRSQNVAGESGPANELAIVIRQRAELLPDPANPRRHSQAQLVEIAGAMRRFGFVNPILVRSETDTIIAGHGRWLAAPLAGFDEVPTIAIAGLSDAEAKALALADNRIAENAAWDADLLRAELEAIRVGGEPISGLGFGQDELDRLFSDAGQLTVFEIATSEVADRFWISVRGPLVDQAEALKRLAEVMADLPQVEVELGTIAIEA